MNLIDSDHRTGVADAADELNAVADRIFIHAPELAEFYAAIAKGLRGSCDLVGESYFMDFRLPQGCRLAVDGDFAEGADWINIAITGPQP